MFIEKISSTEKKTTKTIFGRLTNKFINQQRRSKRDQSVQTGHHSTMLVKNQTMDHTRTPLRRRRSSLKTFLTFQSPKPIFLIHRTRRCSVNFKTPKRLSSECLQVALIRKIQPVNPCHSPCSYQPIFDDATNSREDLFSIGPMKWSTPNRTNIYKTSSPYHNHSEQQHRSCPVDQLSVSNIFDRSD